MRPHHHVPHVLKANTNGDGVNVQLEFSPLKTVQSKNLAQDTVESLMEALEEDHEDENEKNESRQFIEGVMDLE